MESISKTKNAQVILQRDKFDSGQASHIMIVIRTYGLSPCKANVRLDFGSEPNFDVWAVFKALVRFSKFY